MAQSVKLKDGSYIDTEGIYDVTQGMTQKEVNAAKQDTLKYKDIQIVASDYEFTNITTNRYKTSMDIKALLGETYTVIYSANIVFWTTAANMATQFYNLLMDSNATTLTLWATVESPAFTITVRFVYI